MAADRVLPLTLAALWAGASLGAVLLLPTDGAVATAARVAACLPAATYWQGHALLRALGLAGRSSLEWHAFAVALSLASLMAGGFLLNSLGALDPAGWACWVACVTWLSALVGLFRHTPAAPVL